MRDHRYGIHRARWGAAAILALVATACTASGSHAGTTTSPGSSPARKTATGWIRSDLKPVSQPVAAGGRFVLYVGTATGLHLVGLDPADGRTVWDRPASASATTPGVQPALAVIGGRVVYFESAGTDQIAQLTGLDPATGAVAWQGNDDYFADWPGPCFDDATSVCTTGTEGGNSTLALRYSGATGAKKSAAALPGGQSGREIAAGLFDTGARNPDVVAATSKGSLTWQKDLSTIFPGPGYSTDNGWNIDRASALGLYVGSVGGPHPSSSKGVFTADLTKSQTAGFRIADGGAVWDDPGSEYECNYVPCPGQSNATGSSGGAPAAGVRARLTGTLSGPEGKTPTWSAGGKGVLEGFDLSTGKTTWTFDAGRSMSLIDGTTPPKDGADTVIYPSSSGGYVELDLANGHHRSVAVTAAGWCTSSTKYKVTPPFDAGNGHKISDYVGQDATFPCTPDHKATKVPATVPDWVGSTASGLVAWSGASSVQAARIAR